MAENRWVQRHATSWLPGFLINISCFLGLACGASAGDAVAIGYNEDGIWTDITYDRSATPRGGKDYRSAAQAREFATRDVRSRSQYPVATAHILSSSDKTGFVAVARGQDKFGRDFHGVGRGRTQTAADRKALALLNAAGAGAEQKIVYRYFSYGIDTK